LTPVLTGGKAFDRFPTDAAGEFQISQIAPGDYRIRIGYREDPESETVAIIDGKSTPVVHLAPGETVSAVIEVDTEAVVSGRVTDPDGEPVPNAQVSAIGECWKAGYRIYESAATASTDANGNYSLKVLRGRYYFSARPPDGKVTPAVFTEDPGKPEAAQRVVVYPNASSIEGGAEFDLRPAQQLPAIDFKLKNVTVYHVRGSTGLSFPPYGGTYVFLNHRSGDRSPGANFAAQVARDGTFDFLGVSPGSYSMELMTPRAPRRHGRIPVDVIDRDVNGIMLPAIPEFDITGRVQFEDGAGQQEEHPATLQIGLLDFFFFRLYTTATPATDGTFAVRSLRAGVYAIRVLPDRDLYIRSVFYNHHEAGGGIADLSGGGGGELEIVLGTGTGQVDGTIHWPDGVSTAPPPPLPPNAVAVLVSAGGVTGNTGARSVEIDPSGHFQFRFVPPGRHFAFVSTGFDIDLWLNMDFVRRVAMAGVSVDMPAKGNVKVEVPILSAADLDRAIARVPR
jgi:hypothetical protein